MRDILEAMHDYPDEALGLLFDIRIGSCPFF